jgi:hypothetical protein
MNRLPQSMRGEFSLQHQHNGRHHQLNSLTQQTCTVICPALITALMRAIQIPQHLTPSLVSKPLSFPVPKAITSPQRVTQLTANAGHATAPLLHSPHTTLSVVAPSTLSLSVALERSTLDDTGQQLHRLRGGGLGHLVPAALHRHESERALRYTYIVHNT